MKSRLFLLLPAIVIYWKSCDGHCASNPCENGGTCITIDGNRHRCECTANSTGPRCAPINWALEKPAAQSICDGYLYARYAVDGNTSTYSVTSRIKHSWWRVDLQTVIEVVRIVLFPLFDIIGEYNVVVGIYDGVYKRCGPQRYNVQPKVIKTVYCPAGVKGNLVVLAYVGIGTTRITLLEVSVYGSPHLRDQCLSNPCDNGGTCQANDTFYDCICPTGWLGSNCEGTNWALGKKASMSSLQADKYLASNAVDGNTDDMMIYGEDYRCVYSQRENNPYLEIDLEKEIEIRKVVIVNRQDCCSSFLDNFDIVIGSYDGGTNKTCGAPQNSMSNIARKSIYCSSGVIGRTVTITLRERQHLTLCEVEVYGNLSPCLSNPCINAATCQRIADGLSYECFCSKFFTGPYCENVIPCRSYPCENGGTCMTNENETSYNCVCAANWTALNCEYLFSCLSNPCENGGTCGSDENETFYNCICAANWTGPYCDYLFPCISNPCGNGGTCAHKGNFYNCTCPSTWAGSNCEQKQREERKTMSMTTKALVGVGVASVVFAGAAVAVSGSTAAGSAFGAIPKYTGDITARLGATALGKHIRQTFFHSFIPEDEDEEEEDGDDEEEELPWEMQMDFLFSSMAYPW